MSQPTEQGVLAELRELKSIINRCPAVVFLWRAAEGWPVEYVSENVNQFGYAPDDLTSGRVPYARIIHPEDLERVVAEVSQHSREGRDEFVQEYRILTPSGAVRWLDDRTWIRRDSSGVITHYQGIVIDNTARKLAEEGLREARAELERRVTERTADLAKANRMLSILIACNEAVVRATEESALVQEVCRVVVEVGGYPLVWIGFAEHDAALSVRPVAQAGFEDGYLEALNLTWADRDRGRGPTGTAIRSGQPCVATDLLTDPQFAPWRDEAIRRGYRSSIALPLRGEDRVFGALNIYSGAPEAFHAEEIGLLTDLAGDVGFGITSLRQRIARDLAEAALRESEQRYRGLVEHSPDAVAVHDGHELLFANPAADRMLNPGSPVSVVGRAVLDFVHPDSRPTVAARVRTMLQEWSVAPLIEEKFLRTDGSVVDVEVVAMPVMWHETRAIQVTFRDITERKRAEEEREKLQAQLLQAQKMELMGRLAGGVAHDFNNMLGVILGRAELALADLASDDPLQAELQEIQKAALRSADLTRQLLVFARKQAVNPIVLNLNDAVESMLKMLRRLIGEDIALAWMPGAGTWNVKIDPSQIDQVLTNLCVNARDAIVGVGKVVIETANAVFDESYCSSHPGFVAGEFVVLSVSDDGCGMDAGTQAHLFEPFFTTKGVGQGTGLGLATVYGIVRQNAGFINVYSELGKGTTFRIYFPRHVEQAEQVGVRGTSGERAVGGGETVLLVEDEPGMLIMCRDLLEKLGYGVLGADTPQKALRLAEEQDIDIRLLITDIVMPEMSGPDLIRRLQVRHPDLRCLFMSGYTANMVTHRGLLEKGYHFIQKPFTINDLAVKVRHALDQPANGSEQE